MTIIYQPLDESKMALLPTPQSLTAAAIEAHYARNIERPRGYLGASTLGHACSRKLWHDFRWCSSRTFTGRELRLFETGKREEGRAFANLRAIGCTVYEADERTLSQYSFDDLGGHFRGNIDGVALGVPEAPKTWHLVEVKTHGEKSFAALKKDGLEKSKPEHAAQMMIYMGKMELTRALYFSVNKNTDELYCERLRFDKEKFQAFCDKALSIIKSEVPMTACGDNVKLPPCVWCDYKPLCYEGRVADVNCRTCAHSTPQIDGDGGQWVCEEKSCHISRETQSIGCNEHIYIPELIPYAEPIDGGEGWIEYKMKADERRFVNVAGSGFPKKEAPYFSSAELHAIDAGVIGDKTLEDVRKAFDARVVNADA